MRRSILAAAVLSSALWPLIGQAETPEDVRARLERGRERDKQELLRRQETLDWQKKRQAEEHARTWKRYGNAFEVNVLKWWRQKDGNWITVANYLSTPNPPVPAPLPATSSIRWGSGYTYKPAPPKRFDQSLDELVCQGIIDSTERGWISGNRPLRCSGNLVGKSSADNLSLIGVSCISLHVNKKRASDPWGKWERPTPGSPEEALLIDRCAEKGASPGDYTSR